MTTPYTFSVSTDVNGGVLNMGNLEKAIFASNIKFALDHITVEGDVLTIHFRGLLDFTDLGTLAAILQSHDPTTPIEIPTFTLVQEKVPTNGKTQIKAKYAVGNANAETETAFSWNHNISMTLLQMTTTAANDGDAAQLYVTPKDFGAGEGYLCRPVRNVLVGANQVFLPAGELSMVTVGDYIYLDNGVNTDALGYVTSVGDSAVTMSEVTTHAFDKTNTRVLFRQYIAHDFELPPPGSFSFGLSKFMTSSLSSNMLAKLVYINRSGDAKKLWTCIEYLE